MRKLRHPKQAEIAHVAGVSPATVSLVLRGGTGASEKTVNRVREVAEQMGYRPNALVQSIRSGKTHSLGVFVPPYDSHWSQVLEGIHDYATSAHYVSMLLLHKSARERDDSYALEQVQHALDRRVDAVILCPYFASIYSEFLNEFSRRDVPVVTIGQAMPEGIVADTVLSDQSQTAMYQVEHLAKLGHRSFALVTDSQGVGWADCRLAEVEARLKCVPGAIWKILRCAHEEQTDDAIMDLLISPNAPTGFIAGTDRDAARIYAAAYKTGKRIPSDLSIVSAGNLDYLRIAQPTLTTVSHRSYEMGQRAAELAINRASGTLTGKQRIETIPVRFCEGASTGQSPARRT